MWRGRIWLVVVLAGSGCGSSTPSSTMHPQAGDDFVDGTRLKARWLQAPGLPRQFAGWYDAQLGEGCQFEFAFWQSTARSRSSSSSITSWTAGRG